MLGMTLAEKGLLPDFLIRIGIRSRLQSQLDEFSDATEALALERKQKWIEEIRQSPVALVPEKANEQHYELPPEFFQLALGRHLKYSSG